MRGLATCAILVLMCSASAAAGEAGEPDIVIADFEGNGYGEWRATGEAFGSGPARGALAGQQGVGGFRGRGLVNSFHNGDGATGTLVSPSFKIERRFINFLVGGGAHRDRTCVNLIVGGRAALTATGKEDERLTWHSWDVRGLRGRSARIQIVDNHTGGWGHINVDHFVQSDRQPPRPKKYGETYRPQFHFSAKKNWLNDPNGLVYYKGTYHLFFQHNPFGINWGNMHWGHAVSPDMVHWKEVEIALRPDKNGVCFSGSGVVDHADTSGFQVGTEKPIVLIYSSMARGGSQSLGYSTDGGKTWQKYPGNPVLPNIAKGNRDPKVIWHEPTRKWIMSLYVSRRVGISFYSSPDLKSWTLLSSAGGFFECPDLFELPVDGNPNNTRWVLFGADAKYLIGRFDGKTYRTESGKHTG
ncbi:MAG: glycoside hydrolase family 32 protein, partial [Planctomycetota bacterium]